MAEDSGSLERPEDGPVTKTNPSGVMILLEKAQAWLAERCKATWDNLLANRLWQRILKNTLATTIAIILGVVPAVTNLYGKAVYLAAITTVFGHPGRRFGQMAEALALALAGSLLGVAWSTFGIYLSSLVYTSNPPAAYTIKGIFLSITVLFHGYLRSKFPRLFLFVLLLVIVSVVSLTSPAQAVSASLVTTLLYPILTAVALLLVVNVLVFPEFSSDFLGGKSIETLCDTVDALRDAGAYFMATIEPKDRVVDKDGGKVRETSPETIAEEQLTKESVQDGNRSQKPTPPTQKVVPKLWIQKVLDNVASGFYAIHGRPNPKHENEDKKSDQPRSSLDAEDKEEDMAKPAKIITLKSLTDRKQKLRAKLASCKAAQQECNFELAFAVLPPRDLKSISDTAMKKLVANTVSLIGACESKYSLMGDDQDGEQQHSTNEDEAAGLPSTTANSSRRSSINRDSSPAESSAEEEWTDVETVKKSKRKHKKKRKSKVERKAEDIEMIKPQKEIEFGDIELLRHLLRLVEKPVSELQGKIDRSTEAITTCLAYCYDVRKLPSGALAPTGIRLEELDIYIDILNISILSFDKDSSAALESASEWNDQHNEPGVDIMPRMEIFLVSSFLLNLRQAAGHTKEMLKHARDIVEKRQSRHERRSLWAPKIRWTKWLTSGGESDSFVLPDRARKEVRTGKTKDNSADESKMTSQENLGKKDSTLLPDVEANLTESISRTSVVDTKVMEQKPKKRKKKTGTVLSRVRNNLADMMEGIGDSEDFQHGIKMAVAVLLVLWPAFLSQWNTWYYENRGMWAALQLVVVMEVAIGASVWIFILRLFGTVLGCTWGYLAYLAGGGNAVIAVVMLVIGIVPSAYIQLGSKYVKAGMISIISMSIVLLATVDQPIPGTATENYLKRLIAFLIGGIVALVIEFVLFPVKARDRLVESLASAISKMSEMEACLAHGVENKRSIDVRSQVVAQRFEDAKSKAEGSLTAAETFLPFCAQEPRFKGSFAGLALVYTEILFVLHQIIDRMDNMLQLHKEYGSDVLEELNGEVCAYRRNLAGSITLVLFAVHEALTTKLPLPQFLPSARLAHLRVVNRVREVVSQIETNVMLEHSEDHRHDSLRSMIEASMVRRIVRQKFLSWNAVSAGQIEVIEYLEELIDLTKLLVGSNEFRSGLLTRPSYQEYLEKITSSTLSTQSSESAKVQGSKGKHTGNQAETESFAAADKEGIGEIADTVPENITSGIRRRNTNLWKTLSGEGEYKGGRQRTISDADLAEKVMRQMVEDGELPLSLQRMRSRRIEEQNLQRVASRRSQEEDKKGKGKEKGKKV
jgi:uncharacterized membrane protein YgaE (UPF0421/DUF939 family)